MNLSLLSVNDVGLCNHSLYVCVCVCVCVCVFVSICASVCLLDGEKAVLRDGSDPDGPLPVDGCDNRHSHSAVFHQRT